MRAINIDKKFKLEFHEERVLFYTEKEMSYHKFYRLINKLDKRFKNVSHTMVKVDDYRSQNGNYVKYAIFQFGK